MTDAGVGGSDRSAGYRAMDGARLTDRRSSPPDVLLSSDLASRRAVQRELQSDHLPSEDELLL